jgi:hypothetical protein
MPGKAAHQQSRRVLPLEILSLPSGIQSLVLEVIQIPPDCLASSFIKLIEAEALEARLMQPNVETQGTRKEGQRLP